MTDRQKKNWKSYCSEQLEQIENFKAAKADNFAGWCMHHRREIQPDGTRVSAKELIDQNLYYGRPASELVFMRFGEHSALHKLGNSFNKGKRRSEESRQKNSLAHKGKHHSYEARQKIAAAKRGENNPFFGKHLSEEHRQKLSMSLKGLYKSTRWWNNGISSKRSRECPGPEWKRGRIRFYDL